MVTDALRYVDCVKDAYPDNRPVFNQFLESMTDFKCARISVMDIIERLSVLFRDRPALFEGLNIFLPDGYLIQYTDGKSGARQKIRVTTPTGRFEQDGDGSLRPLR